MPYSIIGGRESSVGIATGYMLEFFLLYSVQNGSGAHTASYPMSTGGWRGQGKKLTTGLHLVPLPHTSWKT
jgi:hypothetical protein